MKVDTKWSEPKLVRQKFNKEGSFFYAKIILRKYIFIKRQKAKNKIYNS